MRWARWVLLVLVAVGTLLPWSHNASIGGASGLTVLFGRGAEWALTAGLLGGLGIVLLGTVTARVHRVLVLPAGAVLLVCLGGYGYGIATDAVWSFGRDSAGNFIEWEDPIRLDIGWYVTVAAAAALVAIAVRPRVPARRPVTAAARNEAG